VGVLVDFSALSGINASGGKQALEAEAARLAAFNRRQSHRHRRLVLHFAYEVLIAWVLRQSARFLSVVFLSRSRRVPVPNTHQARLSVQWRVPTGNKRVYEFAPLERFVPVPFDHPRLDVAKTGIGCAVRALP
jgi:hypothetical protein